jgi:hypothetical protein
LAATRSSTSRQARRDRNRRIEKLLDFPLVDGDAAAQLPEHGGPDELVRHDIGDEAVDNAVVGELE